ncbi:uncharacterized protein N7459_010040 [Penicillium hispanicum]|uniref:uncharacterized protein n=1 Tax=Penicillium hispanicum TaxID=1080232 RepID=UPI0025408E10|nr:uncharacterized protein N7459_010040 [Penicillium hispanicum]KAJ5570610.1 hypothetical protein N7459_010040 [Penicillium hispanicum]
MADHDSGGARMPKACRTCAKAKVRCEPESNGPCKRCRRLNKECGNQAPGAHRRQRPARSNLEVSALEAKLDRMVALLAASERSSNDRHSETDPSPRVSPAYTDDAAAAPNDLEGKLFLELFKTKMVPLFPFIVIPPNTTAEQLRREKPFLYLNISIVACQQALRQREISKRVKKYVAEQIVLKGNHSLDLLQGLLVHLAWLMSVSRVQRPHAPGELGDAMNADINHQIYVHGSAQLDAFIQLAVAQIVSMGLNQGTASLKNLDRPFPYLRADDLKPEQIPERTLEERRVYLGCYYMTVMMSACVRDLEPLRFTGYTNECCDALLAASEYPTDLYLVHLTRVLRVADKIGRTTSINEIGNPTELSTPLGLSIRALQGEIHQLKSSFSSCGYPQSTILLFHYDTLEILLYRIALNEDLSESMYGEYPLTRLDLLFRCLEATKSFFSNFYMLPSEDIPFAPFMFWCQFGQAVVTLSRLILYSGNTIGWDRTYVRSVLDFDQIVDGLKGKLVEARALIQQYYGGDPENLDELPEVFGRLSARVYVMKEVHHKRVEIQERTQPQESPDFSFLLNMRFDPFFPYGDISGVPGMSAPAGVLPEPGYP